MYIIFSNTGNWDGNMLGMHGVMRSLDQMEEFVRACEGTDDLDMDVIEGQHDDLHQILDQYEIDLIAEGDIVKIITADEEDSIYVAVSPVIIRPQNG